MAETVDPIRLRRRRRLCIAGLALCALMAMASLLSFWTAPGYMGAKRQVFFIGGGLLIQGAPAPVHVGFRLADADIPSLGLATRLRGWFTLPHRMGGGSLFIPFGPPIIGLTVVLCLLYRHWSTRQTFGLCQSCGYDLRGANHAVCPECGTPAVPELTIDV